MTKLARGVMGSALLLGLVLAAPANARADEPAPTTEPAASTSIAEPAAAPSKRTAWPWIIGGTGLALILTAGVLEVLAVSENNKRDDLETKLFSLPQGDPTRASLQSDADKHHKSATSEQTAALVIGTAGFLAVAGSVVWWFFESPSGTPTGASLTPRPTLLPSLRPGYAGATLGASF